MGDKNKINRKRGAEMEREEEGSILNVKLSVVPVIPQAFLVHPQDHNQ